MAAVLMVSCTTTQKTASGDDGRISINFVQVNDVYEIAPLNQGREGGLARVATIKKKYLRQNPNTFLVMAGDFVSPSVYNSLKYQNKAIRGKQMIEAMNAAGMDIAVFGNHEFDIKEAELQERINESDFQWVSSNTFHKVNSKIIPFEKITAAGASPFPSTYIKTVTDADGTTAKIGFIGLTLPFNKASYVSYADALVTAKGLFNKLKDSVDFVVAITHQSMEEDELLAKEIPGLALILGGHEHDQRFEKIGHIYITKAMANAKSAYITTVTVNKPRKSINITAKLEKLDESVAIDSATNVVVRKWMDIAENSYASLGFEARKVALSSGEPLDGRESEVRNHSTNLTTLIIDAMKFAAPKADVIILNGGSIRVDDILQIPVTQYDLIRTLPFGGSIREADIRGTLLVKILEAGLKNKGIGGYLHYNDVLAFNDATSTWSIRNTGIDTAAIYRVALPDFLLTGGESNLGFLKPGNPDIVKIYDAPASQQDPASDIRLAIIKYLEKK